MKTATVIVLVAIGLLCIAVGVVYFVVPAHSLPSFFPSHAAAYTAGASVKHTKKGIVAVVVGAVIVVVGLVVAALGGRPTSTPS